MVTMQKKKKIMQIVIYQNCWRRLQLVHNLHNISDTNFVKLCKNTNNV